MRRLTAGALAAWLVAVGVSGAIAGSLPTGGTPGGQAVAIPEAGISIEIPPGWRLEPPRTESQGPLTGLLVANNLRVQQTCTIGLLDSPTASEAVDLGFAEPVPGVEVLERSLLTLPVGGAERVFWRYRDLDPSFDYYVAAPAGVVNIACRGDEPPDDRWQSIIESIAVLTDDEFQSPAFDPRVEAPGYAFAVEFPAEWTVQASAKTNGLMFGGDSVLWAYTGSALSEPPDTSECWIDDNTEVPGASDSPLDDWLWVVGDAASTSPLAIDPVATRVDLPVGPSGYVEWTWDGYPPRTAWVFVDADRRLLLSCQADEPPDDHWLSIAETFEFLPVEE